MDAAVDLATLGTTFAATPTGCRIGFDRIKKEQFVYFDVSIQVPMRHLIEELIRFQQNSGRPLAPNTVASPAGNFGAADDMWEESKPLGDTGCQLVPHQGGPISTREQLRERKLLRAQTNEAMAQPRLPQIQVKTLELKANAPNNGTSAQQPGASVTAAASGDLSFNALWEPASPAHPMSTSNLSQRGTPGTRASLHLDANELLFQAVQGNRLEQLKKALERGANVSARTSGATVLHRALEAAASEQVVQLLLQSRADATATLVDGRTPLHLAVSNAAPSPLVVMLLLLANGSVSTADGAQQTPLYLARQLAQRQGGLGVLPTVEAARLRSLFGELSDPTTVALHISDPGVSIVGAALTSPKSRAGAEVIFATPTLVGVYGVQRKQVLLQQSLVQQGSRSLVRAVCLNPAVGTVAVYMELLPKGTQAVQHLILVWHTGALEAEEPLKFIVQATEPRRSEASLQISQIQGSLTLAARLSDAKVMAWRLGRSATQPLNEAVLSTSGGPFALAGDGAAVALTGATGQLELWRYAGHEGPQKVALIDRRPAVLALMAQDAAGTSHIAISMPPSESHPLAIEVISVNSAGVASTAYRMSLESPCRLLQAGFSPPQQCLVSAHEDGAVVTYDLRDGSVHSISQDDPNLTALSLSADRSLVASVAGSCLRVYLVRVQGALHTEL